MTEHPTVVVTDQVFPSTDLEAEALEAIGARLVVADGTLESVARLGADAVALLNTYMPIDGRLLDAVPNCKIVARYGIGVDNVDIAAAEQRGVVVTNVPDYSVEEVATQTLAMLLAAHRRLVPAHEKVMAGGWGLDGLRPISRFSTLTVGLVGFGRIGRALASYLRPLGCRLLVSDPFLKSAEPGTELVELDELLQAADIVSMHAPLTEQTRGMIDARRIAAMRTGAILVNTSRGGLVVLDDVVTALREGKLAAAALDVFESEPLDVEAIGRVPGLIATPHMAYYSEDSLQESQRKAVTQVIKVLSGQQPDYPVTAR